MNIVLFTHDPVYAGAASRAGVHALVVDWEQRDKHRRQAGFDTEINQAGPDELRAVRRAAPEARIICRINNHPDTLADEATLAQELGADELLLPMVKTTGEIERALETLRPGVSLGILAETPDAISLGTQLAAYPLARVYVGLNDLHILRGQGHLFSPLTDGTLDRLRSDWTGHLSVAGVTLPDRGSPLPCRVLMGELARIGCDYLVGRRSFRRDIPPERIAEGLAAIHEEWSRLTARDARQIAEDRVLFLQSMNAMPTRNSACV